VKRTMNHTLLNILIGCVLIAFGAVIIAFRSRVARLNAEGQKRLLGKLARYSAANSTPANTAFVGSASMILGAVALFRGIAEVLSG